MKTIIAIVISLCVWAGMPPQAALAATFPTSFDLGAVDAFLADEVKERGIVGLSVAVVRDGRHVFAKGYGKSSIEAATPVGTETMFAIGSVTKQITAACVLLLAEDGKLAVTDPVAKYYPGLTRAKDITLLDLMHHTSGYPDYYPLDFVHRRMAAPIAEDELIKEFAGGRLDFEPGTRWSYSNTGYVILGRVVEKVSGRSFGQFLEARIQKPLGMEHTTYDPETRLPGMAQGYGSFALGPPGMATREGRGWVAAAGAIHSTPSDLVKWNLALMDGRILKPESVHVMTTPRKLGDGRSTDYAGGLAVTSRQGFTVLTHNGAVGGFNAVSSMVPATRSSLVLLSNSEFSVGPLHSRLLSLMLGQRQDPPKIDGPPALEAARVIFAQMQSGVIERGQLAEDFSDFLNPTRVREGATSLKPLGQPTKVELENTYERGGMEVANVRFTFESGSCRGLMYRTPDGKIQQFLVFRD